MLVKSTQGFKKINNSYFLMGSLRSGTTIIARLISSCKNIAYLYEQTITDLLTSLLFKNYYNNWKILFETYIYDDFFYNFLSGRNFNFNKYDESYIGKSLSKSQIQKFKKPLIKSKLYNNSRKFKILINMKGLIILDKIYKIYPKSKYILIIRNLKYVSNSINKKKWFENKSLKNDLQFPNIIYKNHLIPYWVPRNKYKMWINLSSIDRSYYYTYIQYSSFYKFYKKNKKIITVINYEKLCEDPLNYSKKTLNLLGLKFGKYTLKIIRSIKKKDYKKLKDPQNVFIKKKIEDLNLILNKI